MAGDNWAPCACSHGPDEHVAVVVGAIAVDPGNRVLFEGTLGQCGNCGCGLYRSARLLAASTPDGDPQ